MPTLKVSAYFLAYWEPEGEPPFPCFNIVGGPRDRSTVSEWTLKMLNIPIPEYPEYKAWKSSVKTHQARGINHYMAKLTPETVLEIVRTWRKGLVTSRALADQYGVAQGTIMQILTGRTWRHVTGLKQKEFVPMEERGGLRTKRIHERYQQIADETR